MTELTIPPTIQPMLSRAAVALKRRQLVQLMRRTDGLIAELEQLNLAGIRTLPDAWRARLQLLVASLPFEYQRARLSRSMSPTEALDLVFDIQAHIVQLMWPSVTPAGGRYRCAC
jgi:hypothetical protein